MMKKMYEKEKTTTNANVWMNAHTTKLKLQLQPTFFDEKDCEFSIYCELALSSLVSSQLAGHANGRRCWTHRPTCICPCRSCKTCQ